MDLLTQVLSGYVFFDGAMGTELQRYGILPGESSESWNIKKPEIITEIHGMPSNI